MVLCCATWLTAISQNEYFSNNATWGVAYGALEQFYSDIRYVAYTVDGDSVINNVLYKVIYEDGISVLQDDVSPWDPPGSVGNYSTSSYHNFNPKGFYRSEGKKMFTWNQNIMSEELLYDFDVEIGDTMDVSESMFYGNVVVYDIDSIQIGGEWRKVIFASLDTQELITDVFVEGIGNLISGLDGIPTPNVSGLSYSLTCYSYNGDNYNISLGNGTLLDLMDDPCEFAIGINERSAAVSFDVYPNPAHDNLQVINLTTHVGDKLKFTDISGKTILQEKICKSSCDINTASLPAGIYFLEVGGEVRKVLVER